MVALLLLLTSALPALQTNKKAVTRRNNLVPHISLENSQGKVPGGANCSPFCFDASECDCSTQFQGRKQTDENNPLFPPSFPLYCQSPFHSLSFHSSLSPTSAGFINTFSYGNKQSDKTSPSALLGPDRIFSCWTQCDQHFAHLYFLCCLFHLAWVDHAMD